MGADESVEPEELIDDSFYMVVGRIIVRFGQLEALLRREIAWFIAPGDFLGDALMARISFRDLSTMFEVIATFAITQEDDDSVKESALNELKTVMKVLQSTNESRNNVVHSSYSESTWMQLGSDVERRRISTWKPKLSPNWTLYPTASFMSPVSDELTRILSEIELCIEKYSTFSKTINHHLTLVRKVFYAWDSRHEDTEL